MIKYQRKLNDFQYILSFDLAKRVSGYALWDFKNDKVLMAGVIDTRLAPSDFIWKFFYDEVDKVIKKAQKIIGVNKSSLLFLTKEKLPTQNGPHSTIETLQGLAQAHSIFDLVASNAGIEMYDYEGIHSVSVKAYFKSLLIDNEKPQKEDIAKYIKERFVGFDFGSLSLDVTDALAVAITLVEKKYDMDIKDEIKRIKKELKTYKSVAKKNELEEQIKHLQEFTA